MPSREPGTCGRGCGSRPRGAAPAVQAVSRACALRPEEPQELRPGTTRILFAFDPWRSSVLLVAGDKRDRWSEWYQEAIPLAESRYTHYLSTRTEEEGTP
ncbi:type II toxin-antitoxin system RelE/ParE family toxin [Streptomyces zhihengii]